MLLILILFGSLFVFLKTQFSQPENLFLPYLLFYLVIASHPAYHWLITFSEGLVNRFSGGFSLVNDEEVYQAIRHYHQPEKLENSPLLRLSLVSQKLQEHSAKTPVDALRQIIKETIEYFKPESDYQRRTKQNLKYHFLKMIAFDQAEEEQILWELGFEDYPVRIMFKEGRSRPPLFRPSSPSDYSYTFRNAFLALKRGYP